MSNTEAKKDPQKKRPEWIPKELGASRVEASHTETYNIVKSAGGRIWAHVRLLVITPWKDGSSVWGQRKGHIEDFWVHPSFAGKGYGRQLMDDAERQARRVGCTKIYLTCAPIPERDAARHIYHSRGYQETMGRFVKVLTEEQRDETKPDDAS